MSEAQLKDNEFLWGGEIFDGSHLFNEKNFIMWQKVAGVTNAKKPPEPIVDPYLAEMKEFLDSTDKINLNEMDIDVESYKKVNKEVIEEGEQKDGRVETSG